MSNKVTAEMAANVWKILVEEGSHVEVDDVLAILESMKMEIPVIAETSGTVTSLAVAEGDPINEGDLICVIG